MDKASWNDSNFAIISYILSTKRFALAPDKLQDILFHLMIFQICIILSLVHLIFDIWSDIYYLIDIEPKTNFFCKKCVLIFSFLFRLRSYSGLYSWTVNYFQSKSRKRLEQKENFTRKKNPSYWRHPQTFWLSHSARLLWKKRFLSRFRGQLGKSFLSSIKKVFFS